MRVVTALVAVLGLLCFAVAQQPPSVPQGSVHHAQPRQDNAADDFPFKCFRLVGYEDMIYLNSSAGTDDNGDAYYYGLSMWNGVFYGTAYAHVQAGTGLTHVIITYNSGFNQQNITRAIVIEPDGWFNGANSYTYAIKNTIMASEFWDAPHYQLLGECTDTDLSSTARSGIGSADILPVRPVKATKKPAALFRSKRTKVRVPQPTIVCSVPDPENPPPQQGAPACLQIARFPGEELNVNVTGLDDNGDSIIVGKDTYKGRYNGYIYGLVHVNCNSVFLLTVQPQLSRLRVTNFIMNAPADWASFGPMLTYGVTYSGLGNYFDSPTLETDLSSC